MKAIIVAAFRENGIEMVYVEEKSINKKKFFGFLQELRRLLPFENVMLMMDNLSFHKSEDIKERMDELSFHYTYTPVYSP